MSDLDRPRKRLVRTDDRWIGGVCGAVANYVNVDANLVRIITVIATVFGLGSMILVYLIAWLLIPSE
ncbi:MAG TPA: PspC domain-containing protein [Nocardioidaceae bacterium]|nr:PspC domain-containing protein [Nocardioidaceae bacterium]